jgi:hypothetical protein
MRPVRLPLVRCRVEFARQKRDSKVKVIKPIGILVVLLLVLLGAGVVGAATPTKTPWTDRVAIISDVSEAEGCRAVGPIRVNLKKKWTEEQNLDRLKKSSWGFRCDRILVTEKSWESKHIEGAMFQSGQVLTPSGRFLFFWCGC